MTQALLYGNTTTSVSANIIMPEDVIASAIRVRVYVRPPDSQELEIFSSTYPPLPDGQTAFFANVAIPSLSWYGQVPGSVMVEVVGQNAQVISGMQNSRKVYFQGNQPPPMQEFSPYYIQAFNPAVTVEVERVAGFPGHDHRRAIPGDRRHQGEVVA